MNVPHRGKHSSSYISHPEHLTSQTSLILNIPHPEHPISQTSHMPNITYHILNILNPHHSTSPISPHLKYSTCSICHSSSIPHSQHPTSHQTNYIACITWKRIQYLSWYLQACKVIQIKKFQIKNNI